MITLCTIQLIVLLYVSDSWCYITNLQYYRVQTAVAGGRCVSANYKPLPQNPLKASTSPSMFWHVTTTSHFLPIQGPPQAELIARDSSWQFCRPRQRSQSKGCPIVKEACRIYTVFLLIFYENCLFFFLRNLALPDTRGDYW